MNNLQQDTMLIMGFHAPRGVEYQLSLLNSKERIISIESHFCEVALRSKKTGLDWSPILIEYSVNTTVTDGGRMSVDVASRFVDMLNFANIVARFVESHPQWSI